jgi:hypothetical protein
MLRHLHLFASLLALLTIATFFSASAIVELFGSHAAIAEAKALIALPGLLVLIPAIALTGSTGFALSRNRQGRLVSIKRKRMMFIAANGLLVLVPCVILLNLLAAQYRFDAVFYAVQTTEFLAGATNLALMGLNVRDGLRLAGRRLGH